MKKTIDSKNNLKFPPYQAQNNDIIIKGETRLQDIGIDLHGSIVETPGHTIDSISVLFNSGECFIGDAAANFLQFAGAGYCPVFIMNIDMYYASWRKLSDLNVKELFPGHGSPFKADKLKKNIGKIRKKKMVQYRVES
jgi:hydroxyacylglutathione hydrolase